MKVYQTNEIKNIALLGSAGSGKTTLAEAMVYEAGIIKRRGTVEGKNTMSDYFPVEQEYGYSVFSTVFHVEWNNKKLNIIDCPGSDDFVGGAITALNVTDQAVILINGQYGPEVGTMNAFRNTEKLKKPVIFLVNQLDRDNCDYDQILSQLKEVYGNNCVPVQYPIATGNGFNSVIDVLLMKKYSWKPEGGAPIIEDIPAEEMAKAKEWKAALVEAAAAGDDTLMEKFFESEDLTEDEMREGIRKGLVTRSIYPVFCVCAGRDMGVRRLMEFLGNVVPFVSEMPVIKNAAGQALYCPYPLSVSIPAMTIPHLAVAGVVEALFTVLIYAFIRNVDPDMVQDHPEKKTKGIWGLVLGLIALTPLGLLATGTAWGEWGSDEISGLTDKSGQALGYTPQGMTHGMDFHALIPDYSFGSGMPEWLGYILSAIIGAGILVIVFRLIGAAASGKPKQQSSSGTGAPTA